MEGALEAAQSIGSWTAPALLAGGLIVVGLVVVHLYRRCNALQDRLVEYLQGDRDRAERQATEMANSIATLDRVMNTLSSRGGAG